MEINYKDTMNDKQKQKCLEVSNLLKKYNINSIEEIQGCTLAEFLAKQHPDRYDNSIYQNTDELKQIFAIVNKRENVAVFINLNKDENSKLEVGDFAEQDMQTYKIKLVPELEKNLRTQIEKMSNGVFSKEEQEKMYNEIFKGDLDSLEKTATIDFYLNHEAKRIISKRLDKINDENGKSKEERDRLEAKENKKEERGEDSEEVNLSNDKGEDSNEKLPADVVKACKKLNITKLKGYFYVDAVDMYKKVDNNLVNKNGGKVLILETPSEKIDGPNRYYGMQDEKMVSYGNEDQAIKEVTGKVTKYGQVVKPLKLQEPKAVEYSNGDGLVINEVIDDNRELSVNEANGYRRDMEDLLEKYSRNIEILKADDSMPIEIKREQMIGVCERFKELSNGIAKHYDIGQDDRKNIGIEVMKNTGKAMYDETKEYEEREEKMPKPKDDEPEAFEVPGKRTR